MKLFYQNSLKRVHGLITVILIVLIVAGFFIGCGKLSDDTNRPTSPVGTSGGQTYPIKPTDSVGTYTLSISAGATTLPADGINFTTLHAYLEDSSGRSVENFTINFQADDLGRFSSPGSGLATTTSGFTDAEGHVSVRFLGVQSGSCVIQASVDLNGDGLNDLEVTLTVVLTPAPACPSSAGTYSLSIRAYPNSIPADMATYSTIIAMLRDSSGGSVEDFTITFTADLGYLENDPEGPSSLSTTTTGITNGIGDSSVYLYGARAGSALVQAQVTIPDLNSTVLCSVLDVYITEGAGVPGEGIPGVDLSVDVVSQEADLGTCGEEAATEVSFNLTARVWDETGDRVGSGVRVELSTTGINENLLNDGMTDSTGTTTWTYSYSVGSEGVYTLTATATVLINGVEYTDTITYFINATCTEEDPVGLELAIITEPEEIITGGTAIITVLVTSDGGAVSDADVTFTHTQGLGVLSVTSVTTTSNGLASTTFTGGSTAGSATIYIAATATEGNGSGTSTVTIIDAPVTVVAAAPSTTLSLASAASASLTGTAVVRNASGNFIEGATVGFSLVTTGGALCTGVTFSPVSGAGTTNVAGVAEFSVTVTATAVTAGCTYTITAVSGTITSAAAPGTIIVGP